MFRHTVLAATFVFSELLAVPLGQSQAAVDKVSFCAVARNPEQYNNQEITVKAQYESDGIEREGLTDSACKDVGFALQMRPDTKGKAQLKTALSGGYPGTLDKTVVGSFTGIFHWVPGGRPSRVLTVQSMRDFSVEHIPLPFKVSQ